MITKDRARCRARSLALTTALSGVFTALLASPALAAPTPLVSACSGVSLPPSVVTGILQPVFQGIVNPIQTDVNAILAVPLLGLPACRR